jgi:hypothetical protein
MKEWGQRLFGRALRAENDETAKKDETAARIAVGKRTLTEQLVYDDAAMTPGAPIGIADGHGAGDAARGDEGGRTDGIDVHAVARWGITGTGRQLPLLGLVQRAFGHYDLSGVTAHVGGPAAEATAALGTTAFAYGDHVAFATEPDLFTVAHEAAHVIQQRSGVQLAGGIDARDDVYEQHADQVAAAVVKGESVEALLSAGPRGGASGAAVIQRYNGRERDRIEREQRWDPTIAQPLSAEDAATAESDAAAIRETVRLGFSDPQIRSIRVALGLPVDRGRAYSIDRDLVRCVRRHQGEGGSGVLDEATIFRIDVGARWPGPFNPNAYRRTPPWSSLDETQLDALRRDLIPVLGITDDDLQLSPERRGRSRYAVVSDHFMRRVVNWQLWNHRGEPNVRWGVLGEADLRRIRGEPIDPPAETQGVQEEGASSDTAVTSTSGRELVAVDGSETTSERAGGDDVEAAGGDVRTQLEAIQEELERFERELQSTRRQAAIVERWRSRIDDAYQQASSLGVDNREMRRARGARQPQVRAQRLSAAIRLALRPPEVREPTASPPVEARYPALERRGGAEAMAHLLDSGVVIDRAPLVRGAAGWEGRVLPGGRAGQVAPEGQVREHANAIVKDLRMLRDQLQSWSRHFQKKGAQSNFEGFAAALQREREYGLVPPQTLRHSFRLEVPRDLLDSRRWSSPAIARGTANRLHRALVAAIRDVDRQIELHCKYQGSSLRTNDEAVRCDLSRSGVIVTNRSGRRLRPRETHLDILFAEAMLRFLEDLRGLGIVEMRTAGFLRDPISPRDTHPLGQACDITAFKAGDVLLSLGNGRRAASYTGATRGEYSDWYNHEQQINGQTYAQILQAITARMAIYFSHVTGPGHDPAHDNHWHVELTAERRSHRSRVPLHVVQDHPPEATPDAEAASDAEASG